MVTADSGRACASRVLPGKVRVDQPDEGSTLANSGGYPFDRSGPDITGGEDPGDAGLNSIGSRSSGQGGSASLAAACWPVRR